MPTNLAIDDMLLAEALRLGRHRTKRATVNEALRQYVERLRQIQILGLFGEIDYYPDYDYKQERSRR